MISGLILAGGKGSRLGREKALAPLAGRTLLQWVASAIFPVVDELVVTVAPGRGSQVYEALLGEKVKIAHDRTGGRGPLEGLIVGLEAVGGEFTCVAPCDTPFLSAGVYRVLIEGSRGKDGAVVRTETLQSLIGFFRTKPLQNAVLAAAEGPEPSPRAALRTLNLACMGLDRFPAGRHRFFNINTREELERAEQIVLTGSMRPMG